MILYIAAGSVVAIVTALLILSFFACRKFTNPLHKSMEETDRLSRENGDYDRDFFKTYEFSSISFLSSFGYTLTGIMRDSGSRRTVVLLHGYNFSWHGILKFVPYFASRGYNILAYNHRSNGTSGGRNCSGGVREQKDLDAAISFLREKLPQTENLIITGTSFGAAAALQYTKSSKADAIIAFAPFSSLQSVLYDKLCSMKLPSPLSRLVALAAHLTMPFAGGFFLHKASPLGNVQKLSCPVLLFHALDDETVPFYHSERLVRKDRSNRITFIPLEKGGHGAAYLLNKKKCVDEMDSFLDSLISTTKE